LKGASDAPSARSRQNHSLMLRRIHELLGLRTVLSAAAAMALLVGLVLAADGGASAAASSSPIAACAFGSDVPGLNGYLPGPVDRAAASYAAGLHGVSSANRSKADKVFAAAAAAYVYGFPQVDERATVKKFLRNQMVSVDALANPQVQTVVAPNVDTAYTVSWLDLTTGPMVINVPDTAGRYYAFQFLDAFTNAFAYVGSGSTGTGAGAYVLVPPGYTGSIPAGLTRINTPSNTVWLLGRTLVQNAADLPAVKNIQEQYHATPLAAWEAGTRQAPLVLSQYPNTGTKSIPTGAAFIAELNRDMTIDPPPAGDDCALVAMGPAGVAVPHPAPGESLLDDLSDEAPPLPTVASDPVANAAISAGIAAAPQIVAAAATQLNATSRGENNGWEILGSWLGNYGTRYLARAIVATNLLAANTPQQSMYPLADTDDTGLTLDGSHRYTIRFKPGQLPPVKAFWSLTMYNSSYFLYANQLNRYAVGDRTPGMVRGRDGSLTLYIQHNEPGAARQRANWLPAPSGRFHLILRLYEPETSALSGRWKPAPVFRIGQPVAPVLSRLRVRPRSFRPAARGDAVTAVVIGPARVTYRDSRPGRVGFTVLRIRRRAHCARRCTVRRVVESFSRLASTGVNQFLLTGRAHGRALRPGRYLLRAIAGGTDGVPPSRMVSARFRILTTRARKR
jgi:hypothetical protein